MPYTIHFLVTTEVSTNPPGPLPGATITWPGNNIGVTTDEDGTASGSANANDQETVPCTASRDDYSSQTLHGSIHNTSANPLVFLLQGQGWICNSGCFIVSAATRSPDSLEVRRLQEIRARVAAASFLAAELIAETLREYYRFSPDIAAYLYKDDLARNWVLANIVRPFLAWYALAVSLALEPSDAELRRRQTEQLLEECFRAGSLVSPVVEAALSGDSQPQDAPAAILSLMDQAREAARTRFASWAILHPLVRMQKLSACHKEVEDDIAEWLARAPLESLRQPEDPGLFEDDLNALSRFFDFRPAARLQMGARLASAWPEAVPVLIRSGFLARV